MSSPTHIVLQYSPIKRLAFTPNRAKQPCPEKSRLPSTTVFSTKRKTSVTNPGSPVKRQAAEKKLLEHNEISAQFKIELSFDKPNPDLAQDAVTSNRIELPHRLVTDDGIAVGPPGGQWKEVLPILRSTFPTLKAFFLIPPHLVLEFQELPPHPRPLIIGGLPVRYHESVTGDTRGGGLFQSPKFGRGKAALESVNLSWKDRLSEPILKQSLALVQALNIKVYEIFCFDGFWSIVVADDTDPKRIPRKLTNQACLYRLRSELPEPNLAALRAKVPDGIDIEDSDYATTKYSLLRPRIMLASSSWTTIDNAGRPVEYYEKTTSGILIANKDGERFITVATHGFNADGLAYHPNPRSGAVIGRIAASLPGTGISVVKLNPGIQYTNHTFGSASQPEGMPISGISPGYHPHLKLYDSISIDNPCSGYAKGVAMAIGLKLLDEPGADYVLHRWDFFEKASAPVDRSRGSPILDDRGAVVGLFRFGRKEDEGCLAVAASELQRFGYEIHGGVQQF